MIDPFGNYLCQKIVENSTQEDLKKIVVKFCNFSVNTCKNPHGTRAIQKIYECLKDDEIIIILNNGLKDNIVKLIKVSHLIILIIKFMKEFLIF